MTSLASTSSVAILESGSCVSNEQSGGDTLFEYDALEEMVGNEKEKNLMASSAINQLLSSILYR